MTKGDTLSADFESGFFGNGERAWHGLGTVIEDDSVPSERAVELAGLDWQVEKHPVFVDGWGEGDTMETLEGVYCIRRMTDGRVVSRRSTVGEVYEPLQNRDAFSFMDELMGGECKWHTAGALDGGALIWMLAYLPDDALIAGERHKKFIFLSHRHDGRGAITVKPTLVRIVCRNTLQCAFHDVATMWQTRHTVNMQKRIDQARETLKISEAYFERLQQEGEALVNTKMTSREFRSFLDKLIPLPTADESKAGGGRTFTNAKERQDAIALIYNGAANLENVRGTRWAALNAVVEYSEWVRPVRETSVGDAAEQRFTRALVKGGSGRSLSDSALDLLAVSA
jgi:phage/plasmid-like protein (TIGR03299 family)